LDGLDRTFAAQPLQASPICLPVLGRLHIPMFGLVIMKERVFYGDVARIADDTNGGQLFS
jgi:hypothetical protein